MVDTDGVARIILAKDKTPSTPYFVINLGWGELYKSCLNRFDNIYVGVRVCLWLCGVGGGGELCVCTFTKKTVRSLLVSVDDCDKFVAD